MDRRRFLSASAIGVTGVLAGCVNDDNGNGGDEPANGDENGEDEQPEDESANGEEEQTEDESADSDIGTIEWGDSEIPSWAEWLPATIDPDESPVGYINSDVVEEWPEGPRALNGVPGFVDSRHIDTFGDVSAVIDLPRQDECIAFGDFDPNELEPEADGERDGFLTTSDFAVSENVIIQSDDFDAFLDAYFGDASRLVDQHEAFARILQTHRDPPIVTFQGSPVDEEEWGIQVLSVNDGVASHALYVGMASQAALNTVLEQDIKEMMEEIDVDVATRDTIVRAIYRRDPEEVLRDEIAFVISDFGAIEYRPHDY